MTQTPEPAAKKRASGLNSMLIADLKAMAGAMGVAGSGAMKKAQLVEAIKAVQSGHAQSKAAQSKAAQSNAGQTSAAQDDVRQTTAPQASAPQASAPQTSAPQSEAGQPVLGSGSGANSAGRTVRAARTAKKSVAAKQPDEQSGAVGQQAAQPQPDQAQDHPADARRSKAPKTAKAAKESRSASTQPQAEDGQQNNKKQSDDKAQNNERRDDDQQQSNRGNQGGSSGQGRGQDGNQGNQDGNQGNQGNQGRGQDSNQDTGADGQGQQSDDETGGRRNRRRRSRDRGAPRQGDQGSQGSQGNQGSQSNQGNQGGRGNQGNQDRSAGGSNRNEPDTQILEDDVLVPAAGILDVLDNYAFVRTSGYLPGSEDVYLSLSMVRKFGMRRGDAVVGQVRQPREGERKEKFNPMVRIDSINGAEPETARHRLEFDKLAPLHPSERLRMETNADNLIGRVIDIAAPIGKGQRGLIVSPANAGKTTTLQSIAASVTANNPECHLMVVLVDERPEEVTDFERSIKGEVIASTFDRPASDHTLVAELAIERAKRLVELGMDVVVLLDGITRLGRAYNLATPASGRVLDGGLDPAALHPPKKFFGAARNIENGGSLTIIATAQIDSGSTTDAAIFEEFDGTGNMELRLRGDLADKRLFPAIDAVASGTRREELLLSPEEVAIVWKLRRVLSGLESQEALELLLGRLNRSRSNVEFLMQVQKSTPTHER